MFFICILTPYSPATTEEATNAECPECSYGARCVKNHIKPHSSEANSYRPVYCSCEHFGTCDQVKASTICGTNRITYSSVCHMRMDACRIQKEIHVLHDGACKEGSGVCVCVCVCVCLPLPSN